MTDADHHTSTPDPVPTGKRSQLERFAQSALAMCRSLLPITSDDEYSAAGEILSTEIKPRLKLADELFDPNIRRWHQGHKAAIADKRAITDTLKEAERQVKRAMGAYTMEQRQLREAERQSLLAAANEAVHAEIVEQAAQAYEDGRDADGDRLLASLESLDPGADGTGSDGTDGTGSGLDDNALPAIHRAPQSEHTSVRMRNRFRIIDESKISREYLVPDTRAIQRAIDAHGRDAERMVGAGSIEWYQEPIIAARTSDKSIDRS